jgi:tRNA1(Val) A37 N6-methylase TrmN6
MADKGEYKITFEIFGQKRKCSIMARSIEEAKLILLEQVKKQVVVLKSEYTQPDTDKQYNEAIDELSKIFGFKP